MQQALKEQRCPLTSRRLKVIEQLATGAPAKLIATRLDTSIGSVQMHVQHALEKVKAGNAAGLVALAIREGWME